jgi:para-nitrobenzyl esterase
MQEYIETDTSHGRLRGHLDKDLAVFRGVPYAAAPVGGLRFQRPLPLTPWPNVREALQDGPICPQLPARLAPVMGGIEAQQHEDCLTLTIWAPMPLDGARPILVWFHGGGYASGAGSLPWYSGERLAREGNMVVVSVNFRVGALGYLYHPKLSPGNMGLFDQITAIRWIRDNARAFGGDARQITLMGQSGGAHSILCMLAMTSTRSLVTRAILLSTPFGMRAITAATATSHADAFFTELKIDPTTADAAQRLKELPVADILKAQVPLMQRGSRVAGDPTPPFGPAAVGELPGESEFDAAIFAAASNFDAFLGTTRDEMTPFYRLDPRIRDLRFDTLPALAEDLFGPSAAARIQAARRCCPGATAVEAFSDAQNFHYFTQGTYRLAAAIARAGRRAWVYRFDWSSPNPALAACHCVELPFVFGSLEAFASAPILGDVDERKEALSAVVRGAITRFVSNGDPNGDDLPQWPALRSGDWSGTRRRPQSVVWRNTRPHAANMNATPRS